MTLNPGDVKDETITVTIPKGQKFANVSLVPSPTIASFVTSIDPPGGFGPIAGEETQTFVFRVKLHGIPCRPEPQVITGTINVVLNGQRVVAEKKVEITVPPCAAEPQGEFVYSVKFVCGEQAECECACAPVLPGKYATEINIHNFGRKEVRVLKRVIPVVFAGTAVGREPGLAHVRGEDRILLPPQTATMDDCCRIAALLYGGPPPSPIPLTIGLLEITSTGPLAVTAVYTTGGAKAGRVAIDVEQIVERRP
jgi:hypothetical protein